MLTSLLLNTPDAAQQESEQGPEGTRSGKGSRVASAGAPSSLPEEPPHPQGEATEGGVAPLAPSDPGMTRAVPIRPAPSLPRWLADMLPFERCTFAGDMPGKYLRIGCAHTGIGQQHAAAHALFECRRAGRHHMALAALFGDNQRGAGAGLPVGAVGAAIERPMG